jgi:ABC-type uncharacterized transport system ATPase subunit
MNGKSSPAMLEMRGVCKRYGAVQANRNVDLRVDSGQILGLLGENGSGKSTLMKVLFGMVRADAGRILVKGQLLEGHTPAEAIAAGIGMIHQHFMLINAMSVMENVMLGWRGSGWWLDRKRSAQVVAEASRRYGLDIDPEAIVGDLSFGQRQRVEIVKAVLRGAELLILDEPTSNLSPPEVEKLLNIMRRLAGEGRSVIFISHKLGEVLDCCDEIIVLRQGEVTGSCRATGTNKDDLARMMVGRDLGSESKQPQRKPGSVSLEVRDLSWRDPSGVNRLNGVGFKLCAGEILAIAGVDGNGQAELVDLLAGLKTPSQGQVLFNGRDITRSNARSRMQTGFAYIPVDRGSTSLVPGMSLENNLALRDFEIPPYRRGPWLNRSVFRKRALSDIDKFEIRCAGPSIAVQTLSGGNQQKIVVAREIGRRPQLLLAYQPTWGLDPGAARFVIDQILALRETGAAILFVSSELEEALRVGDRIGVMSAGKLVSVVSREEADQTEIGLMMAGTSRERS